MTSNVLRGDYAGSDACKDCHLELYERWAGSPMRRMTRNIEGTETSAPFDGRVFEFMGDTARLERQGNERFVVLDSKYEGHARYRVTRVVGGRTREDFVGVRVGGSREERVLPVSYVIPTKELRYKGYSVLTPERPGLKIGSVWSESCMFCHNTPEALATLYDDLGARAKYQGSTNDNLLPEDRQWEVVVENEPALRQALIEQLLELNGAAPIPDGGTVELTTALATATRRSYGAGSLLEVGVGCEACHGGSREHVENPGTLPSFAVESDFIAARPTSGAPTEAGWINRTCRRCHSVLFSSYSFTWEDGLRERNPGGSHINSGEARDFQLGGCVEQLSCTTCHDPHEADTKEHLAWLESPSGNGVCTSCHSQYASTGALGAHTHHRVDSEGSSCIACHMPKKNLSLEYDLTRYHRIASPTEPVKVLGDRPLECALCHTDRSVEQLVATMESWWGKRYDRTRLSALYPDVTQNAIVATLQQGKPHEQATALALVDPNHHAPSLDPVLAQFDNRYPLVRYYAREALQRFAGRQLELDMSLPGAALEAQARAVELE